MPLMPVTPMEVYWCIVSLFLVKARVQGPLIRSPGLVQGPNGLIIVVLRAESNEAVCFGPCARIICYMMFFQHVSDHVMTANIVQDSVAGNKEHRKLMKRIGTNPCNWFVTMLLKHHQSYVIIRHQLSSFFFTTIQGYRSRHARAPGNMFAGLRIVV